MSDKDYSMPCPCCPHLAAAQRTESPERITTRPDKPGYLFATYLCPRTRTTWVKPWRMSEATGA